MTTFNDLGLAEPLLKALGREGYTQPSPIQARAIPPLLEGRDLIGIAQTGTGKTAAFVLPLLHKLFVHKRKRLSKTCSVLILSPTRELAAQIADNINTYARFMRVHVGLIVGGVRPGNQIKMLNAGPNIIVATPGRLLDHANKGALDLTKTTSLVIDEADQMLDLGFLPDIRKIVARLPQDRQTALLSATMPTQIRKLAIDLLTEPVEVTVAAVSKPVERIAQSVQHVEKAKKRHALIEILRHHHIERTIVFTRTKRGADRVCKHLNECDFEAVAIHGNKSQGQRERALDSLRSGKTSILVATDIAARGIDVDDVSHVINFEIPNVPEAYVHRIGRTARAGKSGTAITLCDPSELDLLKDIEKLIGKRLDGDQLDDDHSPNAIPKKGRPGSRSTKKRSRFNKNQQQAKGSTKPRRNRRKRSKPRSGPSPIRPAA